MFFRRTCRGAAGCNVFCTNWNSRVSYFRKRDVTCAQFPCSGSLPLPVPLQGTPMTRHPGCNQHSKYFRPKPMKPLTCPGSNISNPFWAFGKACLWESQGMTLSFDLSAERSLGGPLKGLGIGSSGGPMGRLMLSGNLVFFLLILPSPAKKRHNKNTTTHTHQNNTCLFCLSFPIKGKQPELFRPLPPLQWLYPLLDLLQAGGISPAPKNRSNSLPGVSMTLSEKGFV